MDTATGTAGRGSGSGNSYMSRIERRAKRVFLDDDGFLGGGAPANLQGDVGVLYVLCRNINEVKRDVREMIRFGMGAFGNLKHCLLIVECQCETGGGTESGVDSGGGGSTDNGNYCYVSTSR